VKPRLYKSRGKVDARDAARNHARGGSKITKACESHDVPPMRGVRVCQHRLSEQVCGIVRIQMSLHILGRCCRCGRRSRHRVPRAAGCTWTSRGSRRTWTADGASSQRARCLRRIRLDVDGRERGNGRRGFMGDMEWSTRRRWQRVCLECSLPLPRGEDE
jgi:hypothetical protein